MKRFVTLSLLILVSLISFAQDGLKGKWNESMSMMGMGFSQTLDFRDDKAGKVFSTFRVDIRMSMLGIKTSGTAEGSMDGTFKYEGDRITIKWNPDSYKFGLTKPITATYKDKVIDDPSLAEGVADIIRDSEADLKKALDEGEEYFGVQIKGDKLTMKSIGEDGKTETEKFTRVK